MGQCTSKPKREDSDITAGGDGTHSHNGSSGSLDNDDDFGSDVGAEAAMTPEDQLTGRKPVVKSSQVRRRVNPACRK
jgi:hypothetical protein